MSIKNTIFNEDYNLYHIIEPFLSKCIISIINFLQNEEKEENLGYYFARKEDIKLNSIADLIDKNADLDFLSENWNNDWQELSENGQHWNESYQNLLTSYQNIFISHDWGDLISPWQWDDIFCSDAGDDFTNEDYVKPKINIEQKTYKEVREVDSEKELVKSVGHNSRHLQFTHEDNKDWIRLILPTNPRRVEVEDLNRNFWVIGQSLSIICKFLFDDNSPLKSILNKCLKEITEQWENILYSWMDYYLLTGSKEHISLILDLPNDKYHPYRKFDDFDISNSTTDILTERFNFLLGKYPKSKISLLVRLRKKNYYYNHYSREEYPYYGYYNGEKWQWIPIHFGSNDTFPIDITNFNDTGYKNKAYGINIEEDIISYGQYGSSYPAAALRVIPSIIQNGGIPQIRFVINDAAGELVGIVSQGTPIKQYTGTFNSTSNIIQITKDEIEEPIADKTGSINKRDVVYPFYGGEVLTVGLTKVIR